MSIVAILLCVLVMAFTLYIQVVQGGRGEVAIFGISKKCNRLGRKRLYLQS